MDANTTLAIAGYVVIGVASPLVFLYLALRHRTASRWIRRALAILGVIGIPYGTLGVLRLGFPAHFSRYTRFSFDHCGTLLGGIANGVLTSLLLSPEFWHLTRRSPRPNAWLKSVFKR
jgi:multisubunit Na+/H+ antiporter MnhB subunit